MNKAKLLYTNLPLTTISQNAKHPMKTTIKPVMSDLESDGYTNKCVSIVDNINVSKSNVYEITFFGMLCTFFPDIFYSENNMFLILSLHTWMV